MTSKADITQFQNNRKRKRQRTNEQPVQSDPKELKNRTVDYQRTNHNQPLDTDHNNNHNQLHKLSASPCSPLSEKFKSIWERITLASMSSSSNNINLIAEGIGELIQSIDGNPSKTSSNRTSFSSTSSSSSSSSSTSPSTPICTQNAALEVLRCLDLVCKTPVKLSTGSHVDIEITMTGTPLMFAAMSGIPETTEKLLSCGASIDVCNTNGDTALMCAAYFGFVSIVTLLLKKGANIECSNYNGSTALLYAIESGNFQTVKLLVKNGANILVSDVDGVTPLLLAETNDFADIRKFLASQLN